MRGTMWITAALVATALSSPAAAQQRSLFDTPTAEQPAPAAAPAAPAAERKTRAKRAAKPKGPVPARSLAVQNASANTLTGLEVSGDGKSAKLGKPLKPKGRATLRLPALKTCTVTVAAAFEGMGEAQSSELDICKEKSIRFTDS